MKKHYSKPDILFEDFSLCTSIAAGCGVKNDLASYGVCGYDWEGSTVFVDGVNGCIIQIGDTGKNDGPCYHNPSESTRLFGS